MILRLLITGFAVYSVAHYLFICFVFSVASILKSVVIRSARVLCTDLLFFCCYVIRDVFLIELFFVEFVIPSDYQKRNRMFQKFSLKLCQSTVWLKYFFVCLWHGLMG